jgi:glycosyltransferase involved in cell wall biosynthesis
VTDLRITAIVPNYNHARYLPRSIGALATQSVPAHEIIVVDDGSTDNSLEVLNDLARRYPMVRIYPNGRNLGVNPTLRRGLELATGDYVLLPGADDEVRPGLFENAVRMLRQHPQAGVFSGICEWRCTVTGLVWYCGAGLSPNPCYFSPAEMVDLGRHRKLQIAGAGALFRKDALLTAGGWLPELHWFGDWFGTYVVGFRHGLCYVPEVFSNMYHYPTSHFNAKANANAERRAVLHRMLQLLESDRFADVAPYIRDSGLLGEFGWQMVRVVTGHQRDWRFLNPAFVKYASRRCAEVIGRRFFPNALAKWCLKVFYGKS